MCLVSIILGFCVIFCDTQMSGILYRYISDFAWLFFIPTIIVILSIFNCNWQLKLKNSIMEIVIVLIFYSLLYQALYALGDYFMYDMINTNTEFYFKWYYLIQWWL